jgi:hypothetical protein
MLHNGSGRLGRGSNVTRGRAVTLGGSDGNIEPNLREWARGDIVGCKHVVRPEGEIEGPAVGDFWHDVGGFDVPAR